MNLHRLLSMFMLVCAYFGASAKVTVQLNSGDPAFPFPQFSAYANPSETLQTLGSAPQPGQDLRYMEQVIHDAYQIMMNRASYTGTELNGVKYISYDGSLDPLGMSESYGFALQAAAYMGDKATFDGLWLFLHDNFMYNGKKYLDCSAQATNEYSSLPSLWPITKRATDSDANADANITLALAVACRQWGSSSGITDGCGDKISYRDELKQMLHSLTDTTLIPASYDRIVSGIIGMDGYPKSGSTYGETTDWADKNLTNGRKVMFFSNSGNYLSCTVPAYFREFASLADSAFIAPSAIMKSQFQRAAASSDWLIGQHYASATTAIPFAGKYSISAQNAAVISNYMNAEDMQWAGRNALDYLWHGNPAQTWDPATHLLLNKANTYQKDMALRYSTFLKNPQDAPWSNACFRGTVSSAQSYQGVESLEENYTKDGKNAGNFLLNWMQGAGASSAVIGQDLAMMAQMFRQCELLWDGTEGYLESTPRYFDEWFRLLGMLTLSGNMQAPSQMTARANVRLLADFEKGTGNLTVIARNYGTVPASGIVKIVLPQGTSAVPSAKYNYNAATRTLSIPTTVGKISSETLTIATEGFATAADKNAALSFIPTGKTEPMSVATLRVEGKDTYTPMHTVTASDSTLEYNQIVQISSTISLPQGGYLYGGTPGVSFQAASKIEGPVNLLGLDFFHDANTAYLDLGNYRFSYYFFYEGTADMKADISDATGFDKTKAKITFEKIPLVSVGNKKANMRMVVSFPSTLFGTDFLLDYYYGSPDRIHRGATTPFFAQVIFNAADYSTMPMAQSYSYDANAIGSTSADLALINIDHSAFDGTAKTIDRLSPSVCAASAKTTSNVVVEEFDGYQWRIVAGQPPMGDVQTISVNFVDTLPANLDFVDLNNFLSTEILGVKPKYDATTREISYLNPAVPYGSVLELKYLVKSIHNSPVQKIVSNTATAKIGTEVKRNVMELTLKANTNLPQLAVSVQTAPASSPSVADGYLHLTISGGTAPYLLTNGGVAVDVSKGLLPGDYEYLLTDGDGTQKTVAFTIEMIAKPLKLGYTLGDDRYSLGTSVAQVEVTGGVPPYTYLWSNGGTKFEITNLVAGNYTVTVTDALGTKASRTFAVKDTMIYPDLVLTMASTDDVATSETSTASVVVTGGLSPYSYLWNNGEITAEITSLAAGEYTVTVTDANGSTATKSITVTDEYPAVVDPLVLTTSFVDDTKTQGTSTAYVEVKGGTAPYSYKWNNGKATAEISYISAGEYTVTVTDADGSTATKSISVTDEYPATVEPLVLTLSFVDDVKTEGTSTAYVEVKGGTAPYSYKWNNGKTTAEISNISAGEYTVTVTDADGSTATKSITVTDEYSATSNDLEITVEFGDDPLTQGTTYAFVAALGGTEPYAYIWSNGATSHYIDELAAGEYSVTVTDADGSTATKSITVTDEYPATVDPLVLTTSFVDDTKTQGTSTAFVEVKGGTAPYSYKWNNGKATAEISNISAGEYTVTVTDADGSTATKSITVTDEYPATVEPLVLTLSFVDDVKTEGTSTAFVEVKGGTAPYSYKWNNGKTTAEITSLAAGEYTVTVTDAYGNVVSKSVTVTDEYPATVDPLVLTMSFNDDPKTQGTSTAFVEVKGGTAPYSYKWNNKKVTAEITSISAGEYTVTVTDADGSVASKSVTVTDEYPATVDPLVLNLSSNDDINTQGTSSALVEVSGGTAPYSYEWNNGKTTAEITSLSTGEYTVTVTDADGTTASQSVTVTDEYPAVVDLLVLTTSFADDTKTQGTSTAFVEVKGGTAPYSYKWNNGKTTAEITSLAAGEYTVTVTDAYGNGASKSVTVTDEYPATVDPLVLNLSSNDDINTQGTSSALVEVSGGTAPYSYEWNNGKATAEISYISAGEYTVTVTDADGSTATKSITVTDEYPAVVDPITISATVTDALSVSSGGSISLTVAGGKAPYSYLWSNSGTESTLYMLSAGTYTVTVTDAAGTSATATFTVKDVVVGFTLSGTLSVNGTAPNSGKLVLMKKSGDKLEYVQSQPISSADFAFTGLAEANYILLALPTESASDQYLPSYYTKASQWTGAAEISVAYNLSGLTMELLAYPAAQNGAGTISGKVIADFTMQEVQPYIVGSSVSVPVYLMQNGKIVAVDFTDADGLYSFSNIPTGSYTVQYEVAGDESLVVPVVLTESAPSISNLTIDAKTATSKAEIREIAISVQPQPAVSYFAIDYPADIQQLTVVSHSGACIILPVLAGNLVDCSLLPSGHYAASFADEDGTHTFNFVKQ